MSWTQPICEPCWNKQNPHREATRVINSTKEQCCFCGQNTNSGIFVRADPKKVPFPRKD